MKKKVENKKKAPKKPSRKIPESPKAKKPLPQKPARKKRPKVASQKEQAPIAQQERTEAYPVPALMKDKPKELLEARREMMTEILERLAEGESLRKICADEHLPKKSLVLYWVRADAVLADQYARAREEGIEKMAEEILEIADDASNDYMEKELESGRIIEVVDHEHVGRSRLRVEARKFLLAKQLPKKYGDKIEVTGGMENKNEFIVNVTTDQLKKAIAELEEEY